MMQLPSRASSDARALARELSLTSTTAAVLMRRGITDRASAARFLEPRLADLTSPDAMLDRDAAVDRIASAIRAKERICVFGDYDCDGITSAAVLTGVIRALGGEVVTLLADRFAGGYGLSDPAVDRVLETGATLLVTCDCGSSDHDRLARALARGVEAVVIDHHRVPPDPLPAVAFLNPHRPGCGFPYKGLASVGLALSVAAGLRAKLDSKLDIRPWLDLVAIGTVADVAPLDGDNRALVRAGLLALGRGDRAGTRALMEVCGTTPGAAVTGEDISWKLAPRINAPGRLASPALALDLLLATTQEQARAIAGELDQIAQRRKEIDRALLAEAREMLEDPAMAALPVIVLGKRGWHQGVVGIVAGRLASQFGKPTIVIGFDEQSGRGSVRGPAGFHLYDALSRCGPALLGFGGHQAAAGVHVDEAKLGTLRDMFATACTELGASASAVAAPLAIDAILEDDDDLLAVIRDMARFEPCGHINVAPAIALERARVTSAREVKGGSLQMELSTPRGNLRGFGFELGHLSGALLGAGYANVAGRLRRDTYRGGDAVEIKIEAVEVA
jgi:single-stranded-DNA-specific exonuclease